MNTIRMKITLLVSIILVGVLGLMTLCTLISSNKHFVEPLAEGQINIHITTTTNGLQEVDKEGTQPLQKSIIEQSEQDFIAIQLVVMAVLVVVGILFVYILLGKALQPLYILNQATSKIDAKNWNTKIPIPKSTDEVAELSRSFQAMISRLKDSFEQQQAFAQNAAHELKTPLSIMKSSIQVLSLDDCPTIEDYQECTQSVAQSVDDLIEIVNQLLLLKNTDEFEMQATNVRTVLEECISECRFNFKEQQVPIFLQSEDVFLQTNPALLATVLRNLLSNAMKYNKPDGTIYIDANTQDQVLYIAIRDTGIGICKEHLHNVFEPFYREDTSRSKKIPGNGLGLSIVKSIVDKLGGEIEVSSELGVGTIFTMKFPL